MTPIVLLGPQRFEPTVSATLDSLGVREPVALVSAGWQEREPEDDELREHVGRRLINLQLYERHDKVLQRDAELADAIRDRQDRLRELQRLYRLRLSYQLEAARELMARGNDDPFVDEHRRAAIRAVRTLDRQHVTRSRRLHQEFIARWHPASRSSVVWHRRQLGRVLSECSALLVAGGHVAVLLNRLRLFDLPPMLGARPLVAWSAGAMALTERVVLFHDRPPQGRGDPEVLDGGLALCRNLVALPHARRRLRLDDPVRVSLLARRFSPATCVVLEPGARVDCREDGHRGRRGTLRLGKGGNLREIA